MERLDLAVTEAGKIVEGVAVVRKRERKTARNGNSYLVVELCNRTGMATGKVWQEKMVAWDSIAEGQGVRVRAETVPGWGGRAIELEIWDVEPQPGHEVEAEINPVCPVPMAELHARWAAMEGLIHRPGMRELLCVAIERFGWERFCAAPAAEKHHHAYVNGGLLEHSLEVASIAYNLARLPAVEPHVDIDAIIVGALLHDAGKVVEYEWQGKAIQVGECGRLLHHTASGPMILWDAAKDAWETRLRPAGLRQIDLLHTIHTLLSHHGKPEWGSAREPGSVEAMIVHLADLASARIRGMLDPLIACEIGEDGWGEPGWPFRHPLLSLRHTRGFTTCADAAGGDGIGPTAEEVA